MMGSEYEADIVPLITVKAAGTATIRRVEIKKNCAVVHTIEPNSSTVELDWKDPDFENGRECYYYVRVVQENDEETICSPVWIK